MASAWIATGFTPESRAIMAQWRGTEQKIVDALDDGFQEFVEEVESFIKNEYFGSGRAINNRSGALVGAVKGVVDKPLGGFVGTTQGTTTPYARAILGPGDTTIVPVKAKKLWIPVGKNLTPSGITKYTPRELFDEFKGRVKIFTSKKGNTVVFVQDENNEDGSQARFKRKTKAGRKKGDLKGKLMFVLKDQVIIHGTDALALGAQRMGPRGAEILTQHLRAVFPGASGGGGAA